MFFSEQPHRRYNPLTGEWVLVSPHRTKRPWQGHVEKAASNNLPTYDPTCYLCPGNTRAGGVINPKYQNTMVFDNDFAALLPDSTNEKFENSELFQAKTERGICKVICFSPRHDVTLALMTNDEISTVINVWIEQYTELAKVEYINYVQIFENRGAIMGCSNPHPHGQIWANESIPDIPMREDIMQRSYFEKHRSHLLSDYAVKELMLKDRVIFSNKSFVALCPFWAVWPFETMIIPIRPMSDLSKMTDDEKVDLSDAIRRMTIRFDNLFSCSFPYSFGIHQQPTNKNENSHWCFHLHFLPPLLRSATVRKFMVGYELLAMPQRDITAEQSAERLRNCSEVHYSKA